MLSMPNSLALPEQLPEHLLQIKYNMRPSFWTVVCYTMYVKCWFYIYMNQWTLLIWHNINIIVNQVHTVQTEIVISKETPIF